MNEKNPVKYPVTATIDKNGAPSGSCGTYKIFGAMQEGTCSGFGTVVGKDGSIGQVTVEVASR